MSTKTTKRDSKRCRSSGVLKKIPSNNHLSLKFLIFSADIDMIRTVGWQDRRYYISLAEDIEEVDDMDNPIMGTMIIDQANEVDSETKNSDEITEPQEGIFEFTVPQRISTEKWAREHLDCDAIIDNLGSFIIVYAFTRNPRFNFALEGFKRKRKLNKQHILRGISSDGLNSLC